MLCFSNILFARNIRNRWSNVLRHSLLIGPIGIYGKKRPDLLAEGGESGPNVADFQKSTARCVSRAQRDFRRCWRRRPVRRAQRQLYMLGRWLAASCLSVIEGCKWDIDSSSICGEGVDSYTPDYRGYGRPGRYDVRC